jgi:hypothetical protein
MAIEFFYFHDSDQKQIYNWLVDNASDYFDEILYTEDIDETHPSAITMKIGDVEFVKWYRVTSTSDSVMDKYYTDINTLYATATETFPFGSGSCYAYIDKIVKTDTAFAVGFYIKFNYGGRTDGSYPFAQIFTKDNLGNTCFIYDQWGNAWDNGSSYLKFAEYDSNTIEKLSPLTKSSNYGFKSCGCTTLTNIVIPNKGVCYLPDCYLSFFGNLLGSGCTIERNGINYAYNGYIALKE